MYITRREYIFRDDETWKGKKNRVRKIKWANTGIEMVNVNERDVPGIISRLERLQVWRRLPMYKTNIVNQSPILKTSLSLFISSPHYPYINICIYHCIYTYVHINLFNSLFLSSYIAKLFCFTCAKFLSLFSSLLSHHFWPSPEVPFTSSHLHIYIYLHVYKHN